MKRSITLLIVFLALGVAGAALRGHWRLPDGPLRFAVTGSPRTEVPRFELFEVQFDLNQQFDNPYDPEQIDVTVEIQLPDGTQVKQFGFYEEPYNLISDHGRQIVRKGGRPLWKFRYRPSIPGRHSWTLAAATPDEQVTGSGDFECTPSSHPGFVRISRTDSHFFEFSDGSFYYPIGHVVRSPTDERWKRFAPEFAELDQQHDAGGVFACQEWFRRMEANGENFCSIWMAPWWLGLEWSDALPYYEGLGRYSQVRSAMLDHVLNSAEEHGIRVLLFTMNHGMVSSCNDPEWYDNPYGVSHPGGFLEYASDFFDDPRAQELHRRKLRYLLARWGHSPAVAAWSLFSEAEWTEAYSGRRCTKHDAENLPDGPRPFQAIGDSKASVLRWTAEMSDFVREHDVHRHPVTIQFCQTINGNEFWGEPSVDIVNTSAYMGTANQQWFRSEYGTQKGIADLVFGWSKRYQVFGNKPAMIAEWGGTPMSNALGQLESELHTGMWASLMTTNSGATGFWWWNAVDAIDLYPHFRAVAQFARGEDRRGKRYKSARGRVLIAPPAGLSGSPDSRPAAWPAHPLQSSLLLHNEDRLFAYIYSHTINQPKGSFVGTAYNDPAHIPVRNASLELPKRLQAGRYTVEYWDTYRGEVIEQATVTVSSNDESRVIPLIPYSVDLALKMIPIDE